MNKFNTIRDLCEYIWYLEEKYDLFNLQINNIYPWAAFRMDLYFELGKKYGVFEKTHSLKLSKTEKILHSFTLIKNIIFHFKDNKLKKVDTLIFSHNRSQKTNNELIDPYTHYLKKELSKEKISFLDFESPYKGKHYRKRKIYTRYLDNILILRNIKKYFIRNTIGLSEREIINQLSKEINQNSYTYLNIKKILLNNTKKFKTTYKFYLSLFKKTQPKKIYVVVSYGKGELISAAKHLNIEVIELQHGTFSKYHLGYSFPKKYNIRYIPDKFYVWNDYWKNIIKLPFDEKNIIIAPFKHLELEKKRYKSTKKDKNSLIIFSQGGITKKIADKISDNISFFKKFNITIKLHPNEYHMKKKYKYLNKLEKKHNIKIKTNLNLHEKLAISEYQAGVYSTALYEGVEFNCKTILLDLPGIEYMEKFIKKYKPIII